MAKILTALPCIPAVTMDNEMGSKVVVADNGKRWEIGIHDGAWHLPCSNSQPPLLPLPPHLLPQVDDFRGVSDALQMQSAHVFPTGVDQKWCAPKTDGLPTKNDRNLLFMYKLNWLAASLLTTSLSTHPIQP